MAKLHWVDYVLFALTLTVSLGIGIFFALRKGSNKTNEDYLMGNRQLKVLPVALSILVSLVNAIGILGTPVEMYLYGTQFSMHVIAAAFGCIYGAILFVPVFYPLKLTSSFEYFELRFKSRIPRLLGTLNMLLNSVFINGLGLYAPSKSLEAVSGFPWWISVIICGVCGTIYTTIGGMKAVIWTDVFQSVVIFVGLVAVVTVGLIKVGGFAEMWRINDEWGRLQFFNMDPDPRAGSTFWSIVVMMSILWMCMAAAQTSVQRYCALPTMRQAKLSVVLNIPGFVLIGLLSCLCGTVAFAYYAKTGCDPLVTQSITDPNQIVPYYVVDVIGYPGLPGIFIACLYSGSLSTISSVLNASAAVTWEDMLKPRYHYLKATTQATIAKILVFIYGALSIAFAFTVPYMGGTFIGIAFSIIGTTIGPIVGMLFVGALIPRSSNKSVIIGSLIGFALAMWMAIGANVNKIFLPPKPLAMHKCVFPPMPGPPGGNMSAPILPPVTEAPSFQDIMLTTAYSNVTTTTLSPGEMAIANAPPPPKRKGLHNLYAVSYYYYPTISMITVLICGLVSALVPRWRMERTPAKLLFPFCRDIYRRFCPQHIIEDDELEEMQGLKKKDHNANTSPIYKPSVFPPYKDPKGDPNVARKLMLNGEPDERESNI